MRKARAYVNINYKRHSLSLTVYIDKFPIPKASFEPDDIDKTPISKAQSERDDIDKTPISKAQSEPDRIDEFSIPKASSQFDGIEKIRGAQYPEIFFLRQSRTHTGESYLLITDNILLNRLKQKNVFL